MKDRLTKGSTQRILRRRVSGVVSNEPSDERSTHNSMNLNIDNRKVMFRVGLISDTHGLLRPEATTFLRGCDFIVHAGDIGSPNILNELSELAPVKAVRGNNDKETWADKLSHDEFLQFGDIFIYVIHDLAELQIDPLAAGVRVVVSGHSHAPSVSDSDGVLFVNPGSSGPRRFKLPISIGELLVEGDSVSAHIHELAVPRAKIHV